jgi:hypothetical protein
VENSFFERGYADKYYTKGYKTMFLDFIYSIHIGKQHWEKDGQNAYSLNQVGQFKLPESEETTIEVIMKETNGPLKGSMKDHLTSILSKIKTKTPFGLIRPSDGEHTILKGDTLTNCDNWTFTQGGILQKQLLEAIQIVDPNLYIGIPCNTCNKPWNCTDEIYNNFIDRFGVPLAQRTYANIVGNSNWKTFSEFMKCYTDGFFLITSGTMASELPIKERFLIDPLLVNNWDAKWKSETARLKTFISDKTEQLICFSAGPLSKVWIPMCMKANPTNMYMDVGASLDLFTKGGSNRLYINSTHPFSREKCRFKDCVDTSVVDEVEPSVQSSAIVNSVRSKNLMYMCVFHNKEYLELLKILLTTIKFYSKTDAADLLVFTSKEFEPLVQDMATLLEITINVKTFNFQTFEEAACARLYIFEYENINAYNKILYIDTDIIVQNDLTDLFQVDIEDRIYAMREGTIEHEYHGGWYFDFTKVDKNTIGMNSGILLFKNSELVRTIFANIEEHIHTLRENNGPMPCTQDQPFINYHTIKGGNQDTDLLETYGKIYCMDPPPPPSYQTDVILCHFVWPIGNATHKKNRMIQHVTHLLKNYANIHASIEPFTTPNIIGNIYQWNGGHICFNDNGVLDTKWSRGTYKWLDKYTMEANWCGCEHLIKMNTAYTSYISIRKGDLDYTAGNKIN